jgi:hypothetical protein
VELEELELHVRDDAYDGGDGDGDDVCVYVRAFCIPSCLVYIVVARLFCLFLYIE